MTPSSPVSGPVVCAQSLRRTLENVGHLSRRHAERMFFSPTLSYGRHFGPPSPTAKQAAVMILLESTPAGWCIPLTERPQHLPDHPGQISLPGGRVEAGESHLEAACREFSEEMGTAVFPGEVIGELQSVYVYNSDYFVRPFVALANGSINYQPCEREVARLIHLPVEQLWDTDRFAQQEFQRGKARWHSRTIVWQSAVIWVLRRSSWESWLRFCERVRLKLDLGSRVLCMGGWGKASFGLPLAVLVAIHAAYRET